MARWLLATLISLSAWSALPREVAAQQPSAGTQGRRRWETLPGEDRERLRAVYRRLQALPAPQRERLLRRLRNMGSEERRRVIAAARERVAAPGPGVQAGPKDLKRPQKRDRDQAWRSLRRWTEGLPPAMRARVERSTRREQVELFRAYRETRLLLKTFPQRKDEDALLALPVEKLRELASPGAPRPEGVSVQGWERFGALKPPEQKRLLLRLERLREQPAQK